MGILSGLKRKAVNALETLLKRSSGMDFPDKEQTLGQLNKYLLAGGDARLVTLPEVLNVADKSRIIFPETVVHPSRNYTWRYEAGEGEASQLRIGSIVKDNKVLQTDFGYVNLLTEDYGAKYVIKDFLVPDKRETIHANMLIAPWTHYFRKEYFMYLLFIAAKICRIKDELSEEDFSKAVVSYPLFYTRFEKEYLDLLDIDRGKIVDSRLKKVVFKECCLGNNDNWLHPNIADVLSLRKHLEPKLKEAASNMEQGQRIYISRSGRRRVLNEADLVNLLLKYNFKIYEDKPRSVAEQYAIYNSASFIIGPHGSSFANIVWCRPGTHLCEIFPPRYVYNFFNYLARILDLEYSAYSNGPVSYEFNSQAINDDIVVSIPDMEKYMNELFGSPKTTRNANTKYALN